MQKEEREKSLLARNVEEEEEEGIRKFHGRSRSWVGDCVFVHLLYCTTVFFSLFPPHTCCNLVLFDKDWKGGRVYITAQRCLPKGGRVRGERGVGRKCERD